MAKSFPAIAKKVDGKVRETAPLKLGAILRK